MPYSYWTILTGIILQGFNSCFIIVPTFIELNNFAKYLFAHNTELQNVISSTFFNFSFYFADFSSPILGSYFTTHYSFEVSAYVTSFITFLFWCTFSHFYKDKIELFFTSKKILSKNIETINDKESNLIPLN